MLTNRQSQVGSLFRLLAIVLLMVAGLTQTAEAKPTAKTCPLTGAIDMTINYNDDVSCQIDPAAAIALFRFQGTAGEKINVAVSASYYDGPVIALYDPSGTKLSTVYSGSYVVSSDYSLTQTGLYTIRVYDNNFNNTLTFRVFLERWYPALSPSPIVYGQSLSASLTPGEVTDQYAFSGTTGDSIALQVSSAYYDGPVFVLHKPNGDVLDSKYAGTYVVRGEYILPTSGTYLIRVFDNNRNNAWDYSLFLQCLNTCATGTLGLPTVSVALTGCTTCKTGDTFSAKLTASNSPAKNTEMKLGFYLPDASTTPVGDPHLELPPQFTFNGEVLRGPITPAHQRGTWLLCGRVIELAVGEILAASCQSFTITP